MENNKFKCETLVIYLSSIEVKLNNLSHAIGAQSFWINFPGPDEFN